jgi:hypothetical protein
MAVAHRETAPLLYDALTPPFSVRALEQERLFSRVLVARSGGLWERCREAMASLEPHLPWRPDMLRARADCYQQAGDHRAKRAAADLQEFLEADLSAPPPSPAAAPTASAPSPPPP